jgi:PAS domain S-box-containing protein
VRPKNDADTMVMDFDLNDKVDLFAKEIFLHSPQTEGLQKFLADELGRKAFISFLKTEFAEENMMFYEEVEKLKLMSPKELAQTASVLVEKYITPDSEFQANISDGLRANITAAMNNENASAETILEAFVTAQQDAFKIMSLGAFPRFLMSKAFSDYRAQSAAKFTDAMVQNGTDGTGDVTLVDDGALASTWLSSLIAMVEPLPLCVSIATGAADMPGFPLIYVNSYFERMTGYERSDIIGTNCRFLQQGKTESDRSEPESIQRLTEALREGKEVRVSITNFRKDGSPFKNLLAMKPIFDNDGRYAFVLGMQFDIGENEATPSKLQIIDNLFRVLPSTIDAKVNALYEKPKNYKPIP